MTQMLPLRTGWLPAPGGSDDYPPDLPPEWRLAYFANDFRGVLVPEGLWRGAAPAGLAGWGAETPARFRFFLELAESDPEGGVAAAVALGDRFGGLVGSARALACLPESGLARLIRVSAAEPAGTALPAGCGRAWVVPPPLVKDLRGACAWVEAMVQGQGPQAVVAGEMPNASRPLVALLGACRFEDLSRWQAMLELMGLA